MKGKVERELFSLLRKVDGFAYVSVSNVVDDVSVPIRMHDDDEYSRLKESIESEGILVPLILLKKKGEKKYYLVDGRNRLKAARELGMEEVPALIYSYEKYELNTLKEEARYLATVIEHARRHLEKSEILELIDKASKYRSDVKKIRDELLTSFLGKLEEIATVSASLDGVEEDDIQEHGESGPKNYDAEIKRMMHEKEELLQEIQLYKSEIEKLKKKIEELESGEADVLPDAEYFSAEVGELTEEEKERIKKEAEEKAKEIYLAKLKDYEEAIKQLKDDLSKKDREIRMLNEKIKFTKKTTDEVKKALGKVIGINTLVSKINVLMEEAESIADVIGKMEINNLMYSNDEWKVVLEKWNEFKSYVEFLDSQINEAVVLCNKSGGEIIRLVDSMEKNQ